MSFSEWLLQTQQVQEALSKLLGELQNASHQLDNLIQISSSMVKPQ
jgi:hypothetical protein